MLIKWSDLEIGDIIRCSSGAASRYKRQSWSQEDLEIINVEHLDSMVCLHIKIVNSDDKHIYTFHIDSEGREPWALYREKNFFDLVKLGDK